VRGGLTTARARLQRIRKEGHRGSLNPSRTIKPLHASLRAGIGTTISHHRQRKAECSLSRRTKLETHRWQKDLTYRLSGVQGRIKEE